jgi:hypothetical protein
LRCCCWITTGSVTWERRWESIHTLEILNQLFSHFGALFRRQCSQVLHHNLHIQSANTSLRVRYLILSSNHHFGESFHRYST